MQQTHAPSPPQNAHDAGTGRPPDASGGRRPERTGVAHAAAQGPAGRSMPRPHGRWPAVGEVVSGTRKTARDRTGNGGLKPKRAPLLKSPGMRGRGSEVWGVGRTPPPPKVRLWSPPMVPAFNLLAPKAPKQNFGCQPQTLEGEEGGSRRGGEGSRGGGGGSSCGVRPLQYITERAPRVTQHRGGTPRLTRTVVSSPSSCRTRTSSSDAESRGLAKFNSSSRVRHDLRHEGGRRSPGPRGAGALGDGSGMGRGRGPGHTQSEFGRGPVAVDCPSQRVRAHSESDRRGIGVPSESRPGPSAAVGTERTTAGGWRLTAGGWWRARRGRPQ